MDALEVWSLHESGEESVAGANGDCLASASVSRIPSEDCEHIGALLRERGSECPGEVIQKIYVFDNQHLRTGIQL